MLQAPLSLGLSFSSHPFLPAESPAGPCGCTSGVSPAAACTSSGCLLRDSVCLLGPHFTCSPALPTLCCTPVLVADSSLTVRHNHTLGCLCRVGLAGTSRGQALQAAMRAAPSPCVSVAQVASLCFEPHVRVRVPGYGSDLCQCCYFPLPSPLLLFFINSETREVVLTPRNFSEPWNCA